MLVQVEYHVIERARQPCNTCRASELSSHACVLQWSITHSHRCTDDPAPRRRSRDAPRATRQLARCGVQQTQGTARPRPLLQLPCHCCCVSSARIQVRSSIRIIVDRAHEKLRHTRTQFVETAQLQHSSATGPRHISRYATAHNPLRFRLLCGHHHVISTMMSTCDLAHNWGDAALPTNDDSSSSVQIAFEHNHAPRENGACTSSTQHFHGGTLHCAATHRFAAI